MYKSTFCSQPQDSGVSLESVLDKKLEELKSGTSDTELLQHEKMQEFNQRMWNELHKGKVITCNLCTIGLYL